MPDFFVSYTGSDERWAEWIGWTLEAAGFSVVIQKWDFTAGSNFVLNMQRAAAGCKRTIAVLSPEYLRSAYAAPEWASAFASDPQGLERKLVPVRVVECKPDGLLEAIVYIDLAGCEEEVARHVLLNGVAERRAKPSSKPDFPGKKPQAVAPAFPGSPSTSAPGNRSASRYMPKIRGNPSDLEKRRFLKSSFDIIQREFDERLGQLARENASVEVDLTSVDSTKFTAEIFVNGRSRARCKVWQGGMFSSEGISYSEGSSMLSENACNDVLALSTDGELALRAMMNMGVGRADEGLDIEHLSPDEAAEYLWRRFTWGLG
jgi:TIR domain